MDDARRTGEGAPGTDVVKRIATLLSPLRRVVPRREDVAVALSGALTGFVPLAIARLAVSKDVFPAATFADLRRVLYGEAQFWLWAAFVGAFVLRLASAGRPYAVARFLYHLVCTVLLLLSVTEVVFYAVTGSRADFDLLSFFLRDLEQVLPVVASEVKAWHLGALAVAALLAMSPMRLRFRPAAGLGPAIAWIALLGPVLWMDSPKRATPAKQIRDLQPSLAEHLYWDGLDRIGEYTLPPPAGALEELSLRRTAATPLPNVVLVVLESVGAKNTTLHDPKLPSTPNLVELAAKGLKVENAFSVVPHTSKALITTLCGYWPKLVSEMRESQPGGLPNKCLPELLESIGYRTAFFQTARESFEYRGDLTFRMGFDLFRARDTLKRPGFAKVNYFGIEDRAMLAPGMQWSTSSTQPFFATYLTLTSHHDYGVPPTFEKLDFPGITGRREQHLNAVRYVDTFVGELIESYEERGYGDNTLFVVLGDHGEAFGEHGRSQHDLVIYEEGLQVPMVIYGPGVLGGRTGSVEGPRQQIDVLPTILDVVGAEVATGALPGTSLLDPAPPDRKLHHSCWRSHRCVATREENRKFIDHYRDQPAQVFDLAKDPKERKDLGSTVDEAEIVRMREEVRAWRARVNGLYDARHDLALERLQTPDTETPAIATWDGKLDLLGCTPDQATALPSQAFWVTCRWRANEEVKMNWQIQARLEGKFKAVEANVKPVDGHLPTYKWRPGWVVTDQFRVYVPSNAKPGKATLSLGWERYGDVAVPLDGGDERIDVATVEVVPFPKYEEEAAAVDASEPGTSTADEGDDAAAVEAAVEAARAE